MASNINPTNIDIAYPVAGQDNDTKGFRDNFTIIKNNFTVASSEISDLQTTLTSTPVYVKKPVSYTSLGTSGQVAYDTDYFYICTGTNQWGKIQLVANGAPYGNANVAAWIVTDPTITAMQANIGLYQLIVNANLGTATNNITTLFSNVTSQATAITSLYTNANANTAAYLTSTTVKLGTTSSNVVVVATTPSTSVTTGALVVNGGQGIAGDIRSSGNVLLSSQTGAIGYTTGAGGTVTQSTNKSTTVALNRPTGQITCNGATLAANTAVSFAINNTVINSGDIVILNHISAGQLGAYGLASNAGPGFANITVRNNSNVALGEAIVLQFAVIKSATA
jgi:hypothetical protein